MLYFDRVNLTLLQGVDVDNYASEYEQGIAFDGMKL